MQSYSQNLRRASYQRGKELRKQATLPERLLWNQLAAHRSSTNLKFRRQQPIDRFIVDFVCFEINLVVEIDGPSHDAGHADDAQRDAILQSLGYHVMRFTNQDVLRNLESVIATIHAHCAERSNSDC